MHTHTNNLHTNNTLKNFAAKKLNTHTPNYPHEPLTLSNKPLKLATSSNPISNSQANVFTTSACMSDSQNTQTLTYTPHRYRHTPCTRHTTHTTHEHAHTPTHSQQTTHTRPICQFLLCVRTWDSIDCRHIDHLALHQVQAMELVKNMKTHNSQFGLCNEPHWLQSNMTAACPRVFEILTTLTFGAQRQKNTLCHRHSKTSQKNTKKLTQ